MLLIQSKQPKIRTHISKINIIKSTPKHALDLITTRTTSKHIHQYIKSYQLFNQNMMRQNKIKSNKTKQISKHE